jgi:hypothetical protein
MDRRIVELVGSSDFERNLYEAAVRNLADVDNKLRFNNFAYAMRELSRHFLHRLAPDEEVTKCSWYKNVTGKEGMLARSERAAFAVHGGLSDDFVRDNLGLDIQVINKRLKDAVDGLSKYTHIEEAVFDLPPERVDALVVETTEAFAGLFEAIRSCRCDILYELQEAIDDASVSEVLSDTIQEIDELATHHSIDEIYVHSTVITRISHDTVYIKAEGTIGVELQYGSNSDWRRGDGAKISMSFPFGCELTCPTSSPDADFLKFEPNSLEVDNRKWHEGDAEEYEDLHAELVVEDETTTAVRDKEADF